MQYWLVDTIGQESCLTTSTTTATTMATPAMTTLLMVALTSTTTEAPMIAANYSEGCTAMMTTLMIMTGKVTVTLMNVRMMTTDDSNDVGGSFGGKRRRRWRWRQTKPGWHTFPELFLDPIRVVAPEKNVPNYFFPWATSPKLVEDFHFFLDHTHLHTHTHHTSIILTLTHSHSCTQNRSISLCLCLSACLSLTHAQTLTLLTYLPTSTPPNYNF